MILRFATVRDAEALAAIYGPIVESTVISFETVAPSADEMRSRIGNQPANKPWIVAEIDRTVAGYAYASSYRPRPAYRFTVENSVYLRPSTHRRGIGRQLLERLIAECEARGFRQMIAVIGDSANVASIGVHAACGFQLIGTHPSVGLKFGRWLDTVMMQRALGAGASTVPSAG